MIRLKDVVVKLAKESLAVIIAVSVMTIAPKAFAAEEATNTNSKSHIIAQKADEIYKQIDFGKHKKINTAVFEKAYQGYLNLKESGYISKEIISICDFALSSNTPRLWVIDLSKKKVLYHTWVAHGQGTGEEFATKFSNTESSHQSSMGFYVTGGTYTGNNGYSLRLNGMDAGYNDNALDRAIVMHGADYVSQDFINNNNRLGRSWGCPAVSRALAQPIINTIQSGSCLFISVPDKKYLSASKWLKKTPKAWEGEILKEKYNHAVANAQPAKSATQIDAQQVKNQLSAPEEIKEDSEPKQERNQFNKDGSFDPTK